MADYSPTNPATPLTPSANVRKPLVDPKLFITWLFIASSCMLFAGLTSAYILASKDATWNTLVLPNAFLMSTIVIVLSSATMHLAVYSAKKNNLNTLKIALGATLVLGCLFLALQWTGYGQLVDMGFLLVDEDKNGAYLYVLSGAHGVHIIAGLLFLLSGLIAAFRLKIHSRAMTKIYGIATFWHFLDILWLYLFAFFTLNG